MFWSFVLGVVVGLLIAWAFFRSWLRTPTEMAVTNSDEVIHRGAVPEVKPVPARAFCEVVQTDEARWVARIWLGGPENRFNPAHVDVIPLPKWFSRY